MTNRSDDLNFDLDHNGVVDFDDVDYMLGPILNTVNGDVNLDSLFNSADLVAVFSAGEFEDAIEGNSLWSTGDWNCDGDFGTADLVTVFRSGDYVPDVAPPVPINPQAADELFAGE